MEYAVIQMVSNWLGRGALGKVDGFNALRASFEQDLMHPVRDVGFIGDEIRDDCVAARSDPPAARSLYVMADGPSTITELNPNQGIRDSIDVRVVIRYVVTNPEEAQAVAESYLAVRTILRSMGRLLRNENAASRSLYSVDILGVTSTVAGPVRETIGNGATVTGAVVIAFRCRDRDVA